MSETGKRLAEIRERVASATPGPWDVHIHASSVWPLLRVGSPQNVEADALFVEYARDDIPFLLAEVERLEQRNHLEAAVVAAALALRRVENAKTFPAKMGWSEAWGRGVDALGEAADALLAFNGEEAGDE